MHRLPAPALALLAPLLPTEALLAAASTDRACRAALLGEVTRLRLTAAPLIHDPAAAGAGAGAAAAAGATQIGGLLARCPGLRRLEGPFHHKGLQQLVGQALALLPSAAHAPSHIEALAASSPSAAADAAAALLPAPRRSRLWSLYAHQQPPCHKPGPAGAGAGLLGAAASGRLPALKRLDLGAMGVAYLDDGPHPTARAAAAALERLGQGAWPALTAVVLGPGVYAPAAAASSTSPSSLAEGIVRALGRRRALAGAGAGAVAPLEELRLQRLRDYGEEEEEEAEAVQQQQPLQQQPLQAPLQLQLRIVVEEEQAQGEGKEDDKENAPAPFSPPASPRAAAPVSPGHPAAAFHATPTPPTPATAAAAAAAMDAGGDWRVVEGALAAVDPGALRVLEVTGGCGRKSRRWGRAAARFLAETQAPALRELVLTPDAALGEVLSALARAEVAPGLQRLCFKAPEAVDGGSGGGSSSSSKHPRAFPPRAVRAGGEAVAAGGLASLRSLAFDGATDDAPALAALLAGVGACALLEVLELPLCSPSHWWPTEEEGAAVSLLRALAACLRDARLPRLRRLRLPLPAALMAAAAAGGGGGNDHQAPRTELDRAWLLLLGALADAPALEEVVLASASSSSSSVHAKARAVLAAAVREALPLGAGVTWW